MRKLAVVLLAAALPLAAIAGKSVEMKDPVTVDLTTKASAAQVKKAVKLAVLGRRWTIGNEKSGSFDATYERQNRRDDLMAKIRVSYDTKKVTIKYLDSRGLSAAGKEIHPTYNKWVDALARDIPIFLDREVTASE